MIALSAVIGIAALQDIVNCFQTGRTPEAGIAEARMLLETAK